VLIVVFVSLFISACQVNGQDVFNEGFLESISGDETETELTTRVRQALKNNGQTAILRISVSLLSEGSIKLSGSVPDSATAYEAERVAYGVSGVRIVANDLYIR